MGESLVGGHGSQLLVRGFWATDGIWKVKGRLLSRTGGPGGMEDAAGTDAVGLRATAALRLRPWFSTIGRVGHVARPP